MNFLETVCLQVLILTSFGAAKADNLNDFKGSWQGVGQLVNLKTSQVECESAVNHWEISPVDNNVSTIKIDTLCNGAVRSHFNIQLENRNNDLYTSFKLGKYKIFSFLAGKFDPISNTVSVNIELPFMHVHTSLALNQNGSIHLVNAREFFNASTKYETNLVRTL